MATLGAAALTNGSFGPVSFTVPATAPPGSYRVQASDGTNTATSSGTLTVVAPPQLSSISGTVRKYKYGGGGEPLAGVTVKAGGVPTTTDAAGNYTLAGLQPGSYTLILTKAGYTFAPVLTAGDRVTVPGNATGRDFTGFDKPPIVFVLGWQGLVACDAVSPDSTFGRADNDLRDTHGYYIQYAQLTTSFCGTPTIEANVEPLMTAIDQALRATGRKKVILVAHSMGGIVSRAYIEGDRYRGREDVERLITLGSPHLGIPMEIAAMLSNKAAVGLKVYCLSQAAVCDMSAISMLLFNIEHPRRTAVEYHTISGAAPFFARNALGRIAHALVAFLDNDGLVLTGSGTGLGGGSNSWVTDEVHSTVLGSQAYFQRGSDGQSRSFLECLKPLLTENGAPCHAVTMAPVEALAELQPNLTQRTPVELDTLTMGQSASHTLTLPGGPTLFTAQWNDGTLAVTLTDPGGLLIDPAYATAHPDLVSYEAEGNAATYYLPNAVAGAWRLTVQATNAPAGGAQATTFAAFDSSVAFTGAAGQNWYSVGSAATLTATLSGSPASAAVTAQVVRPDGVTDTVTLTSAGGDSYQATYTVPATPGYTEVQVTASGTTAGGAPFTRGANLAFQIASNAFAFSGAYSDAPELRGPGSPNYAAINVSVGVTATAAGAAGLSGDLAAGDGTVVAHAVTSQAAVVAGANTLTLRFDGAAIAAARKNGPYTLTNLLLTDQRGASLVAAEAQNAATTAAYDYARFTPRALAFSGWPQGGSAGFALGVQPAVTLQDGQGAALAGDSATAVTLRIKPGTGTPGAALACEGGLNRTVSAGRASFAGCAVDLPGAGYVLEAVAGDATLAASPAFDVAWAGDTDGDCRVSPVDFSMVVSRFGAASSDPGWNDPAAPARAADLDGDGRVGAVDFSLVVSRFGSACPAFVLSPASGPAGSVTTVIGAGFAPGAAVTLTWDGAPAALAGPVTADPAGSFAVALTAPAGAPSGAHTVKAAQPGGPVANAMFVIP